MAKQKGIIRIEGTIGELNFYHHSQYGYLVRTKGGSEGDRIRKDPAFERSRENAREFGQAARAGKLIRQALRLAFPHYRDKSITHRLTQCLVKVKTYDHQSPRGERRCANGLTTPEGRELLLKLDFWAGAPLDRILVSPYNVDLAAGTFSIPSFSPAEALKSPSFATHVRLQVLCVSFDFEAKQYTHSLSVAQEISLDAISQDLLFSFDPQSGTCVLLFLNVHFIQEMNGGKYLLEENAGLGVVF